MIEISNAMKTQIQTQPLTNNCKCFGNPLATLDAPAVLLNLKMLRSTLLHR